MALESGDNAEIMKVPGISIEIVHATLAATKLAYADVFRHVFVVFSPFLTWLTIARFVYYVSMCVAVLASVFAYFTLDVTHHFTNHQAVDLRLEKWQQLSLLSMAGTQIEVRDGQD